MFTTTKRKLYIYVPAFIRAFARAAAFCGFARAGEHSHVQLTTFARAVAHIFPVMCDSARER